MSFYPELDDMVVSELIDAFNRGPQPGALDEPLFYYPDVAVRLAEGGPPGIAHLEAALDDADPFRVYAAIIALGRLPDVARYEPRMVALLNDERPLVHSGAIEFLTRHNRSQYLQLIVDRVAHPEVAVAAAALGHLAVVHPDIASSWLLAALHHPDPRIRWRACDGFEEMGRPPDAAVLRPLLQDPDEEVRDKAARSIQFLRSGELSRS